MVKPLGARISGYHIKSIDSQARRARSLTFCSIKI